MGQTIVGGLPRLGIKFFRGRYIPVHGGDRLSGGDPGKEGVKDSRERKGSITIKGKNRNRTSNGGSCGVVMNSILECTRRRIRGSTRRSGEFP